MSKLNERLASDYYRKNPVAYPGRRPEPPTVKDYHKHLEQNGDLSWNVVKAQLDGEYKQKVEDYERQLKEYCNESTRLDNEFWTDLREEFGGTLTSPFAPLYKAIEYKAYEDGHSGGYEEIMIKYMNLVEMIHRVELDGYTLIKK